MADIKNFGIVGVGGTVQYGKGGGSFKWDTDGFVSTTNGTTLADLDAATMNFTGLSGTGAVTVTNILDEDNMASDSATALATQQSIKAYVDSQTSASTLGGTGDSGAFSVNLATDTFGVFGGTNLTSTGSGSNVTVALDADISLTSVTATGTIEGGSLTDGTATLTGGDLTGAGDITATGTITGGTLTDGTATLTAGDLTTTGTVDAGTLTDGTATLTGGALTGATSITATGTITGGTLTDGTASINSGAITGATNITASGTVEFGSLTDGTITVNGFETTLTGTANTVATSDAVKDYVDAAVGAADLDFQGDSGTGAVDLDSQALDIAGGTNLTTAASGQTLTVNMDADISLTSVTATGNVDAGNVNATGDITAVNGTFSGDVTFGSGSGGTLSGLESITAESVVATSNIILNGYEITDILDEDNMASDSDTAVPTQQSVKAYVDAQLTAADLDIAGDTGTGSVDLDSQVFTIAGGIGLSSTTSGQTTTVRLDNTAVTAGTYGDATNIPQFTVDQQGRITSASNVAIQTSWTLAGDSGSETVEGGDTATFAGGNNITTTAAATDTLTIDLDTTLTGMTAATFSGTVTAGTLTDGTASLSAGSLTGGVNGTFSGTVQAASLIGTTDLTVAGFLVDGIIDDDTMATASATTLATSESVKAYVDAQVAGVDQSLEIEGDSGTGSVNLTNQNFEIAGGTNINTSASGNVVTVNLDANPSVTSLTATGTVEGGTLTDGTLSSTGGTITGGVAATFSGTVTGGTLTDGTASISSGAITGATDITATGTITGGTLTDGTASLASGALSGATTGSFSGTVTAGNVDASTGLVTFNTLSDGTLTMSAILDEDNMASDSDTALATQQSIKAYVDSSITGSGVAMNIQGDTGSGSIVFATDTLDIAGTANEIETSYDSGTDTMTIGLPDDVTISGDLTTGGNTSVNGTLFSDDITSENLTLAGDAVITGNLTVNGNTTIINSNTIASGDAIIVLNADLPSGTAPSQDAGIEINRGSSANVHMLWKEGVDYFEFADENDVLQEVRAGEFNAATFTGGDYTGGNATISGDVAFGTLTDTGESITVTKFVDEADGIANNDNDTTIPTSAAVKDYVDNNAGDGNILRNGSVGTGANTVTIATVPNVAGRTYYVEKVVVKVTTLFSGNSVDHIIVAENGGLGTQIVTANDTDVLNTGTYVVESDGATELTAGQTITLGFRDSGNNLVAPTAGSLSCTVFYGWV